MSYFASLVFHDEVIDAAESMAPLPDGVVRLAELAADPISTVNDIAAVVTGDVALTTLLLREANSASSLSRDPIETVQGAVVRLGTGRVVAAAVGASVGAALPERLHGYGASLSQFWQHATAASVVAESIIALSTVPFTGGLVTAALLQNVGSIVLDPYMPSAGYQAAFVATGDQAMAERELIGIDHGAVGALLCRHWQLPAPLCTAVEHHHLLEDLDHPRACALHVSDVLVCELVPGVAERGIVRRTSPRFDVALDVLGIDDVTVLVHHVQERLAARNIPVQPFEPFVAHQGAGSASITPPGVTSP